MKNSITKLDFKNLQIQNISSSFTSNNSIIKHQILFQQLLKLTNIYQIKKESNNFYSFNSEKNIQWCKYLYYKKPINLLFSTDQFLFEFLKKIPQRKKFSQFKLQLKERKKLKIFYGSLSIKEFLKIVQTASQSPGYFSKNILSFLETRLDVILYRSNFTKNINQARQLILHEKILINNLIIKSPSYRVKPGDVISIKSKSCKNLVETLKKNIKIYNLKFLLPEKSLSMISSLDSLETQLKKGSFDKKIFELQKHIYFLIKLLSKKIQLRVSLENIKMPYQIKHKLDFLSFIKYNCLISNKFSTRFSNERNSLFAQPLIFRNSNFNEQKIIKKELIDNLKLKLEYTNKYYYRNILFKLLGQLELSTIPHNLLILKLSKFIKKKPSKKQLLQILQFYGIKPMHLEVSYQLMKIIFLYSPQRIYYPFFLNIDILKHYKN